MFTVLHVQNRRDETYPKIRKFNIIKKDQISYCIGYDGVPLTAEHARSCPDALFPCGGSVITRTRSAIVRNGTHVVSGPVAEYIDRATYMSNGPVSGYDIVGPVSITTLFEAKWPDKYMKT